MSAPLQGIRILEVASWTFVPAAAALLGDLGADVIKIEPAGGDPQRGLRNALNAHDVGPNPFVEIPNHGKRSVTLDLEHPGAQEILLRLATTSDAFLTNHLPSVCRRLGIDVETLRGANPGLIYVRGSGWGPRGPMAGSAGYDLAAAWAAAGYADRFDTGAAGPPSMPPAFFDLQAATTMAGAVSTALFKRERTGEPSVVDVALMNVAMWAASPDIVAAPFADRPRIRTRQTPINPLSNWYRTADGRWLFLVLVQSQRFWSSLCEVMGRTDLIDDPRFADADARSRNRDACVAELDSVFAGRTLAAWQERFVDFRGAWAPALTFEEVHHHPQVRANGFLTDVTGSDSTGHDSTGHDSTSRDDQPFGLVTSPMHFDGAPTAHYLAAPEVGQHTETTLAELGFDWDEISQARDRGWLG